MPAICYVLQEFNMLTSMLQSTIVEIHKKSTTFINISSTSLQLKYV